MRNASLETPELPPSWGGSPTSTNATTVSLQPKAPSAYTTALNDKNTPKMQSTYAYQLKKKIKRHQREVLET